MNTLKESLHKKWSFPLRFSSVIFFIDIITPFISSSQIACDVISVQHVTE